MSKGRHLLTEQQLSQISRTPLYVLGVFAAALAAAAVLANTVLPLADALLRSLP